MILRQAFEKKKSLLFIGVILLMTLVMSSITKAGSDDPDSDKPKVHMENGQIIFVVKSKAASDSNNIRYRTTGFTLSMTSQSKMLYKIEN